MRHEWDMAFADSGPDALKILGRSPFDMVVTDMRMPAMDGIQLLSEIKRLYPQITRIIFSGDLAEKLRMKSAQVSHQSLAKPCDSEMLKSTIARTFALYDLLADNSLKQMVSKMDSLPSIPSVYSEIMEILRSEDASTREVGKIIEKDTGMTAKILQLSNSAFFGLRKKISSPADATTFLGIETIKTLVLSFQIFSQFDLKKVDKSFLEELWSHNMLVGTIAKKISEQGGEGQKQDISDQSFMAGLLHDCGKLVLADHFPEKYCELITRSKKEKISFFEGEREIFDVTHSEVGAYLMGIWGLPVPIIEVIAFHHCPGKLTEKQFSPLTAVHVANALAYDNQSPDDESGSSLLDYEYLSELSLADHLTTWTATSRSISQKGGVDE